MHLVAECTFSLDSNRQVWRYYWFLVLFLSGNRLFLKILIKFEWGSWAYVESECSFVHTASTYAHIHKTSQIGLVVVDSLENINAFTHCFFAFCLFRHIAALPDPIKTKILSHICATKRVLLSKFEPSKTTSSWDITPGCFLRNNRKSHKIQNLPEITFDQKYLGNHGRCASFNMIIL